MFVEEGYEVYEVDRPSRAGISASPAQRCNDQAMSNVMVESHLGATFGSNGVYAVTGTKRAGNARGVLVMVKARIVRPNFKDNIGNCPFSKQSQLHSCRSR